MGASHSIVPVEFRKDAKFEGLKMDGPVNHSHGQIRRTYVEIRDNKPVTLNKETIQRHFNQACAGDSELWNRSDDTPKELRAMCPVVRNYLENALRG